MFEAIIFLCISLALILVAAEGFTNGVEVVGRKMAFSQAVVGSILAAVGTALPETILPLVAIFMHGGHASKEVAVGAILGAPFMLATIGFFLIGATALFASRRDKRPDEVRAEKRTLRRDLLFFIVMYAAAIFMPMLLGNIIKIPLAIMLVAGYVFYVIRTVNGESSELEHFEGLHIVKLPAQWGWVDAMEHHVGWAFLQIAVALGAMIFGAHLFVQNLSVVSFACGMDPLLFALLIAPIATELPEKFNSVTWTLKGKDTLAVGNMTGAMVFQATFPVSVGLVFTSWHVDGMALVSALLALVSALVVLYAVLFVKRISPVMMMLGGLFYFVYAWVVIFVK